jgi:hypothetical protein
MGESRADQERLVKDLVGTFRCPVCRHSFQDDHVRVAARYEQLWIVSVRCRACRKQQVFWIALKESETLASDEIEEMDLEYFADGAPVCADDVLDMHEFLREFNGDFVGLFARSSESQEMRDEKWEMRDER